MTLVPADTRVSVPVLLVPTPLLQCERLSTVPYVSENGVAPI